MARAGGVLENPATGERLTFSRTGAETCGDVPEYELRFVPGGFAVGDDLHPYQQERHEVVEGELGLIVDGCDPRLWPGDVETVPPRTRHRIYAVGNRAIKRAMEGLEPYAQGKATA